ncbi:alpha/beta hydrolase [Telluribacter sp. SYSU D00476]|uniref:alpha/beta hydrolase n=1 Tax=Telluribacter sp. SYSU D00476 TaxID=2811430 RepID=UPI001FF44882|nr:alpha/beta hydrolase [Telluribacter sp. SYSU D00476]
MSLRNLLLTYILKKQLKRDPKGKTPMQIARGMRFAMNNSPFAIKKAPKGFSFEPVDNDYVKGEWVYQTGKRATRTMLYLHGGGFIAGSPVTHRALTMALAKALNARLLVPDYRLAPEHTYPAALQDAQKAYQWLLDQGVSTTSLSIAGDSAGGGLTLSLLTLLRDSNIPLPGYGIVFSPWADMTASGNSLVTNDASDAMFYGEGVRVSAGIYPGKSDPANPLISPVFADCNGFPPLLIFASSSEVLLDDALRVAENARKCGVPVDLQVWPKLPHVWPLFVRILPEAKKAIRYVADFVNRVDRTPSVQV